MLFYNKICKTQKKSTKKQKQNKNISTEALEDIKNQVDKNTNISKVIWICLV